MRVFSKTVLAAVVICVSAGWWMGLEFAAGQNEAGTIKGWKRGWLGLDLGQGRRSRLAECDDRSLALRRARLATQGKVYDLGVTYSRRSYKWPGHSPGEIVPVVPLAGRRRSAEGNR